MVPPCFNGTSILYPGARPGNVSEALSSDRVVRRTVSSPVSLLALREGTLDFLALALQNGLCRFQSCEAESSKSER